ncbi:unnamed protein product, partial [Ectocarpus sp. 12 AP-2014]
KGGRRSSGPVGRLQAESVRQVAISMPQNQHCSSSNRGIVSPLEAHAYACDRMINVGGDFSSLQNIPGGHHNHPCCQHQHLHSSSGSGARTTLDTSRTRSQSSDARLYWRVAGEMEGGGSSEGGDSGDPGGRRDISCNLALSDFSQLSFLAKVRVGVVL